jgi:hypothetical protein
MVGIDGLEGGPIAIKMYRPSQRFQIEFARFLDSLDEERSFQDRCVEKIVAKAELQ